jgi:hypothetical protein
MSMTDGASALSFSTPQDSVIAWLLDSDPAIRWQVMRDLIDEPEEIVAAERLRVGREGWGAQLLALQSPDGHWGGEQDSWDLMRTVDVLRLLMDFGLAPETQEARESIELVRERLIFRWHDNRPFFDGETEPCINGRILAVGAYFGESTDRVLGQLLNEQLNDGGWNCEAPASSRSSFHTTICVLEGLLEYELRRGVDAAVTDARHQAQEYLLERRMFRSLSIGEVINPDWFRPAFPIIWHYDLLRGLDYFRKADVGPDERVDEAVEILANQRDQQGRWPLHIPNPERIPFVMESGEGNPSRWNTLRALRVLNWYPSYN